MYPGNGLLLRIIFIVIVTDREGSLKTSNSDHQALMQRGEVRASDAWPRGGRWVGGEGLWALGEGKA